MNCKVLNSIKNLLLLMLVLFLALSLVSCASKPKSTVTGTKPYTVRGQKYYPLQTAHGYDEEGIASWYGPGFHGKKTANGETYNQNAMTAAHKLLPLGTTVRVTNLENNNSLVLRINDRGPFLHDRIIDVSKRAADRLDMLDQGTARVRVEAINTKGSKSTKSASKTYAPVAASGSVALSSNAIDQARKDRTLNEQGEIPDDLKYLYQDGSSRAKTVKTKEPEGYAYSEPSEQAQEVEEVYQDENSTYDANNASRGSYAAGTTGDFYVQVGAFTVKKSASLMAGKLEDKGFPARSYKEEGQKLWRVRIGPWSTDAKAREFLPRFMQEFPDANIVVAKPKPKGF